MSKILKPYEVALEEDLARELLATPMEGPPTPPPRTIGERVSAAITAVKEANEYLQESQLAKIVADTLMKQLKKRGVASVRVRPDGVVILHISYDEDQEEDEVRAPLVQRASRKSDLPKLDQLRREAAELGVDVSDLGQQRRAIFERVQAERERQNGHGRLVDEVTEGTLPDPLPRQRAGVSR